MREPWGIAHLKALGYHLSSIFEGRARRTDRWLVPSERGHRYRGEAMRGGGRDACQIVVRTYHWG